MVFTLKMLLIKAITDISPCTHFPGILKAGIKHDESTVPFDKPLFLHKVTARCQGRTGLWISGHAET